MPTLPSGRVLALSMNHILEPGVQMFACPEGHYWYQEPDRALNAPPFQRDMDDYVSSKAFEAATRAGQEHHA